MASVNPAKVRATSNVELPNGTAGGDRPVKTVYFYKDADPKFGGVKLTINPRKYRSFETLLDELGKKIPSSAFGGVRSVYTPRGRTNINRIAQLKDHGQYVCSSSHKAKGLDMSKVQHTHLPPWQDSRSKGKIKLLNGTISQHPAKEKSKLQNGNVAQHTVKERSKLQNAVSQHPAKGHAKKQTTLTTNSSENAVPKTAPPDTVSSPPNSYLTNNVPKKIVVARNGQPHLRHKLLLNRRTAQTFEHVLSDLGGMFGVPVKKLYTSDGKRVTSLQAIFNGPEELVACGPEKFKPTAQTHNSGAKSSTEKQDKISKPGKSHISATTIHKSTAETSSVTGSTKESSLKGSVKNNSVKKETAKLAVISKGEFFVMVKSSELASIPDVVPSVSIFVYGILGNSGPHPLCISTDKIKLDGIVKDAVLKEYNFFARINIGEIGELFKLRINHDNADVFPGWFCEEVLLKDFDTLEEVKFECRRWLSRSDDDGEVCRELPAVREMVAVLPILKYQVTVVTGNKENAGTTANVFLTMYGQWGDTGLRELRTSKLNNKKFQPGQTDLFYIEAVSLGILDRIIIGHDGLETGDGWFLDKVVIKEYSAAPEEYIFTCQRWLDMYQGEGVIVRLLLGFLSLAQPPQPLLEFWTWGITELLTKSTRGLTVSQLMWDLESWKFKDGTQLLLFCKGTGGALRIMDTGTVDAVIKYENKTDLSSAIICVHKAGSADNIAMFSSAENSHNYLTVDDGKVYGLGKGDEHCEFVIHVQTDRSILLESVVYPSQYITMMPSVDDGVPDPDELAFHKSRQFHVYIKGMFRDNGVVKFYSSRHHALTVDSSGSVSATSSHDKDTHFRVVKVSEKGVRMFRSIAYPTRYLQISNGLCDVKGTGDETCQFMIDKMPSKGYVMLQSAKIRGMYVAVRPNGAVFCSADKSRNNIRFYVEVIKFGKSGVSRSNKSSAKLTSAPAVNAPSPPVEKDVEPIKEKPTVPTVEAVDTTDTSAKDSTAPEQAQIAIPNVDIEPDPTPLNSPIEEGMAGALGADLGAVGPKLRMSLGPRQLSLGVDEESQRPHSPFPAHLMQDLEHVKSPPVDQDEEYNVYVKTAADSHECAEPYVYLTAYSELTCSDEFQLTVDGQNAGIFKPGAEDLFEIELHDVHPIVKLRLRLGEGQDQWQGWHVEQVILKNKSTGDSCTFEFDKWLSSQTDGEMTAEAEIEQFEGDMKVVSNGGSQYQASVTTGDRWGSETDADLYIVLFGSEGESGKHWLTTSDNAEKFQRNQTDVFTIPCEPLGDLYKIIVGHNGIGYGAGIFLDKIVVSQGSFGNQEYIFPCGRWLDDGQEDGKTERELGLLGICEVKDEEVDPELEVMSPTHEEPMSEGIWDLSVTLLDPAKESTRDFTVTAHGTVAISRPVDVHIDVEDGIKEFKISANFGLIGELNKIVLERQTDDITWNLHSCTLVDNTTHEELKFILYARTENRGYYLDVPVIKPCNDPPFLVTYMIEVYTLDRESEGELPMFINLIGEVSETGKRWLRDSGNSVQFVANQVDKFEIETVALGPPRRLVIGHDNQGEGEGVKIEKIVIREGPYGPYQATFLCNTWLDVGRDDRLIVKELQPSEEIMLPTRITSLEPPGDEWNTWLKLDEKQGSKDVRMFVMAYGSNGKTDDIQMQPLMLNGNTYQYLLTFTDVGELYKLRLSLDSNGEASAWFINKMKLKNVANHQEFVYSAPSSLQCSADMPISYLEVPVIKPDVLPLEMYEYVIQIYTADIPGAGKEPSHVWVILHGENGDTGKRLLGKPDSNNKQRFQQGQVDEFQIAALDLGKLDHVTLEHDARGRGCGWYVEKVLVKTSPDDTVEQIFPVNRWIDDGSWDRSLQVKCQLLGDVDTSQVVDSIEDSEGVWSCTVTTDDRGCHEGDRWSLVAYGDDGISPVLELQHLDGPAKPTKFDLDFGKIGKIYKIRVTYENEDDLHFKWPIRRIKLQDKSTSEILNFDFSHSLHPENNNMEFCRELPAIRPGEDLLKVMNYWLCVYTGVHQETQVDPNVYVTLVGSRGDTGRRLLCRVGHNVIFQRSQVDIFAIEAVDIGDVETIKVRKNPGGPWHLKQLVLKEEQFAPTESLFAYDDWLGGHDGEDRWAEIVDVELKRTAVKSSEYVAPASDGATPFTARGQWTVWTVTGPDHMVVGNMANASVLLVFVGSQRESQPISLGSNLDDVEPGSSRQFQVDVEEDVGELLKVRIGFDDPVTSPCWFLQSVKFQHSESRAQFSYNINSWVKGYPQNPGWKEIPVYWPGVLQLPILKYQVEFSTTPDSNIDGISDANISMVIHGQQGSTGKRVLHTASSEIARFKPGQVDKFEIEAIQLGELEKVSIDYDTPGSTGWMLEKVCIRESPTAKDQYEFFCERWFTKNGAPHRDLDVTSHTEVVCGEAEADPENGEKIEKDCVDTEETAAVPATDAVKSDKDAGLSRYIVEVHTSLGSPQDMTADVHITLYGDTGDSGKHILSHNAMESETSTVHKGAKFNPGTAERFIIKAPPLGKLQRIVIGHDNKGSKPSWYLDKVTVKDEEGNEVTFPCDKRQKSMRISTLTLRRDDVALRRGRGRGTVLRNPPVRGRGGRSNPARMTH